MTTTAKMTEEQMFNLVRNALLVAGQEMGGKDGDHWPVIKDTIHHITKDWEDLQTERDIDVEVKKHYDQMIVDLEALAQTVTGQEKTDIENAIVKIREISDACFGEVDERDIYFSEEEIPVYVKRAEAIISTLGDDDGH